MATHQTDHDLKAIARRIWDACSTGDLDTIDELFDETWIYHERPELGTGPEGLKAELTEFRKAVPDIRWTIEDQLVEGDKMVTRWTAVGTHSGTEMLGIAPTGKRLRMTGIAIERVVNGKVVESWENWSAMDFFQQLGALPQLGEAPDTAERLPDPAGQL